MKMNSNLPNLRTTVFAFASAASLVVFAQKTTQASGQSFTLQQAIEYAVKNSPTVQGAQIDYDYAKAQKNQIRGIGLPQISFSTDYRWNQRNLFASIIENTTKESYKTYKSSVPNTTISEDRFGELGQSASSYILQPSPILNADSGKLSGEEKIFVKNTASSGDGGFGVIGTAFNSPYTSSVGFTASQIIFSSDYIVALQTAKTYLEFSKQNIVISEVQLKANVAKAYYTVLVSKERAKLLDANVEKLKKNKEELMAYNKQGFIEKIDVDRIEVAYTNLITEVTKVKRLLDLGEASLKFNMSYDISQPITLTDSIIDVSNVQPIAYAKPDYNNRPEYILAQKGQQLNALALKRDQYSVLPTIAAFAQNNWSNYSQFASADYFTGLKWYRQTVLGASLSLPIFSGGQKYYAQKMSKLKIQKTAQDIRTLENVINIETQSSVINYNNAILSMQAQKKNMELASEIFRVAQIKYTNGSGSSLEVLNAQTSLREAQINYTDALYSYYNAKIDYEKATGTLK
jgi:outer membrane protein